MKILIANTGSIPVKSYGGTERVIWYLGKELKKMGHEITYLVNKGSHSDFARIIEIDYKKEISLQIPDDIDVIHFNFQPPDIDKVNKPYVITMHGNVNDHREFDRNTIFVSRNHAERFQSSSYVYNGLDWNDYMKPTFATNKKYFHFLGHAAWRVKNVKGAIDLIDRTKDQRLKVLGGYRLNLNMGFRLTLSWRTHFCGMVGGAKKNRLLDGSKGLIYPVKWHEPFGLAVTESLFFGCPVFATPYGSLKEIVQPEVGFLSNKESELLDAINNVATYSPKTCHEYAVDRFNSLTMAKTYLEKYHRVMNRESLNESKPSLKVAQESKFLPWYQ